MSFPLWYHGDTMQRKHIISIAGKPGSGKSTTAKLLAETLGLKHYSTGDFFREIGKELGLDVLATNKAAFSRADIDQKVDQRQKELGEQEDDFVIDARLGWYFIPQSFKVYLDLDFQVAAERILQSVEPERRASEHLPDDPKEYAEHLRERRETESARYEKLYGVNPGDTSNYDLVIDTEGSSPDEIAQRIIDAFAVWYGTPD